MKKRLEIIAVGNEVLTGATVNTNAAWLARAAFGIGWETGWMTTVGDEPEEITKALQCAVKRAGAVLVSGGLGPTEDDLTLAVAASTFGVKLHLDEQILAKIEARFRARGLVMPQTNRSQAMVPIGAEVLVNPSGTAPGIWWQPDNLVPIAFMPGVPGELRDIWKTALREKLLSMVDGMVLERWLHMTGVGESALMEQLAPLVADLPVEVFPYAGNFQVSLRLVARGINSLEMMSQLEQCEEIIRQVAGEFCYGKNEDTLESAIGDLLIAKGKTLAVAESCTGGLISSRLTDVAGASNWIAYNVVAYANQKKIEKLGVSAELIDSHGAISEVVVKQMARGIRRVAEADLGLAVTGIAGPTGGSREKPIGTVWLAVTDGTRIVTELHNGSGGFDRKRLKEFFAQRALNLLRRFLLSAEE